MVARGIHHVGVAVNDLDEALATYTRLFDAELEHRAVFEEQGVEALAVLVGDGRVELLVPLGEDTHLGRFLAKRGEGMHHVAYEVDDVGAALGRLSSEGARADRRAAAPRPVRARGRVRSSATPSTACSRRWCQVAEEDSVRVELCFDGGQIVGATVTVQGADELERALATQAGGTVMLDASDGRYTVALSRLVYMKRYARESRVGFGI